MRSRTLLFSLALAAGTIAAFAQSPAHMGTWKLDEAKSKINAGAPKNTTVIYEAAGDQTKVTTEGTGPDGAPRRAVWTGKFDGKDYPVTDDPYGDTRAMTIVNPNTFTLVEKKAGKPVLTGRITLSADGKHRTTVLTTTGADGKKVTNTLVYDKQ